jgi:hypothetical protein
VVGSYWTLTVCGCREFAHGRIQDEGLVIVVVALVYGSVVLVAGHLPELPFRRLLADGQVRLSESG